MRLRVVEDLLRRPEFYKCLQHEPVSAVRILYQCIELSVGKRARAAFAELYVRGRIQHACFKKARDIRLPLLHPLSTLDHHRGVSVC